MPGLYVVDTNVIVSGVTGRRPESAPAWLLSEMLAGRLPFLLSVDLLGEYRRVLLRPAITLRHGWTTDDVDVFLSALTMTAYLRQPTEIALGDDPPPTDDPPPDCPNGDGHIVDLLAHEGCSVLISGDRRLLLAIRGWRNVLTPAEAVIELTS